MFVSRLTGGVFGPGVQVDAGLTTPSSQPVVAAGNIVGPEYLRTLGLQMLAGREFTTTEARQGREVVVINQNLGAALWPGRSPLGAPLPGSGARLRRQPRPVR